MNKKVLGALLWLGFLATAQAQAAVKWHPGHYVMLSAAANTSQNLAKIDEVGKESALQGVEVRVRWYTLERSKGRYDFSSIDAYLKRLKAQPTPKRLVVRIMDRKFGTTTKTGIVPDYLLTSTYNGGVVKASTGYVARLWEPAVMDRLIALYKALGARYDGDPYFEGVATEETTLSLKKPFPSGYSHTALASQYTRFMKAVKPSMPHTNVFMLTNFIGSSTLMGNLMQSFVPIDGGIGDSNVIPGEPTLGQRTWMGYYGADYRGNLAIGNHVESGELGGNHGDFTPKQLNDYAYQTLRANYVFWVYNTFMGDSSQRWSTGILPFLRTKPPVRTACPTSYGSCMK